MFELNGGAEVESFDQLPLPVGCAVISAQAHRRWQRSARKASAQSVDMQRRVMKLEMPANKFAQLRRARRPYHFRCRNGMSTMPMKSCRKCITMGVIKLLRQT
jgi:hypothetical protein